MPKPSECVFASLLVYEQAKYSIGEKVNDNWVLIRRNLPNNDGYVGIALEDQKQKEMLIAHMGTDFQLVGHMIGDYTISRGKRPHLHKHAYKFSSDVRNLYSKYNYLFYETGHSLGAALAELNAFEFNSPAITFDSPGIKDMLVDEKREIKEIPIVSYLTSPNPVNTCNTHIGKLIRVYIPHLDTDGLRIGLTLRSFISQELPYSNYLSQHLLSNITNTFDKIVGQPFLQTEILSWPTQSEFLEFVTNASQLKIEISKWVSRLTDLNRELSVINQDCENKLYSISGYQLGAFITPSFENLSNQDKDRYCQNSLENFNFFYGTGNHSLREILIRQLNWKPTDETFSINLNNNVSQENGVVIMEQKNEKKGFTATQKKLGFLGGLTVTGGVAGAALARSEWVVTKGSWGVAEAIPIETGAFWGATGALGIGAISFLVVNKIISEEFAEKLQEYANDNKALKMQLQVIECNLKALSENNKEEIQRLVKEHADEIMKLVAKHEQEIKSYKEQNKQEIENYKKQSASMQREIDNLKKRTDNIDNAIEKSVVKLLAAERAKQQFAINQPLYPTSEDNGANQSSFYGSIVHQAEPISKSSWSNCNELTEEEEISYRCP